MSFGGERAIWENQNSTRDALSEYDRQEKAFNLALSTHGVK